MGGGFATVVEEQGVLATQADVNGFELAELRFPPGFVQDAFEPDLPYLAVVVDGTLEKSFRLRTMRLERASGVTMPAGAGHAALFGARGARIVVVKPKSPSGLSVPPSRCSATSDGRASAGSPRGSRPSEGAKASPDQSSLVGFGDEAANEAFCNSPALPCFGP